MMIQIQVVKMKNRSRGGVEGYRNGRLLTDEDKTWIIPSEDLHLFFIDSPFMRLYIRFSLRGFGYRN